ncbi:hypothetical protein MAPG_07569 [Magnaporthiopsis poae ATCC 64411]|uniref:Bromo domain-containing protein n=1 Tax=Magnaporthiopsis poae (strain ATCC 64411 / 73-15) TaxID=644358 RepID=A0A0C4E510_MAGP6|nr:hypothetical protein MAPG_07569 [Magnaporthiopsis poae ATCC 64411]
MENKRKAAPAQPAGAGDGDDRASKRRKGPAQGNSEYDLFQGESPESTTHYGQQFLFQIRRTSDKTGRLVATYFEKLLPREGNEDYYAKTRMPLSLETIEQKLANKEFSSMSELESYFKRMVSNAKDFYDRGTQIYDDAERVRKALSNYMVKTNPAYKLNPSYSAVPVPIPDNYQHSDNLAAPAKFTPRKASNPRPVEAPRQNDDTPADAQDEDEEGDDDGEGEDEGDESDDGDADGDSEAEVVAAKRRGPGRPPKKPDVEYEGVPYKGLTFQQAQEKIVEELLRKKEQEDDDFAHFEPFLNLPPRQLRDYYQVIKEPICLKKLHKLVRGIHSRRDKGGKSDFKTWAAFEEKASLLWENAYYYNEDGSEIWQLAKELEDFFGEQLREAKAVVAEPPAKSIKLKMTGKETPNLPKKITIHVAPGNSNPVGSPGPVTAQSVGSMVSDGVVNGAGAASGTPNGTNGALPIVVDQAERLGNSTSASVFVPPPTISAVAGPVAGAYSPAAAVTPGAPTALSGHVPLGTPNGQAPVVAGKDAQTTSTQQHNTLGASLAKLYDSKCRHPGRGLADALITQLVIRTHPNARNVESRFECCLPAHPKLTQQSVSVNIPVSSWNVQIMPTISPQLLDGRRPYKLYAIVNGRVLPRVISPPLPNGQVEKSQMLFDAQLQHGVNKISLQIVAAAPKDATFPDGIDAEFEMINVLANLVRQ